MTDPIVSVTLARDSAETIESCLKSALESGLVDRAIVVDTGSTDDTVERAAAFDDRVTVLDFAWPGSFSVARNTAFRMAYLATRAGWGIMLDSDETLLFDMTVADVRAAVTDSGYDVHVCRADTRTHLRERVFKLPMRGEFVGPTHEQFVGSTLAWGVLDSLRFAGRPKTPEQSRRKYVRDVALLEPYVLEHPTEPRWTFHLADSLAWLGELDRARRLFRAARDMPGWDEERAYASFRAGQLSALLEDHAGALSDCITGLTIRADIAECAWLAGWAWVALGHWEQVVVWARTCEAIVRELPQDRRRGFRFQKDDGHFPQESYGPAELLRLAYARLGRGDEAAQAEAEYARHMGMISQ